jgi:hypothetical protein
MINSRFWNAYIRSRTEVVLLGRGRLPFQMDHPTAGPLLPISGQVIYLPSFSLMVQLEKLSIRFHSPLRNRASDVEWQSHQTPDTVTLPNLQRFDFQGVSADLEGLVAPISAPLLNTLRVSFTVSHLLQLMQTSKNLTFSAVHVTFGALSVSLHAVPCKLDTPLLLKI